jgi:hypothetical protein
VPDILSQGEGRPLGPWPRRVAYAVVLVLAVVAVVHFLPRTAPGTARPRAVAVVTPPPAVAGAVSGDAGVAAEPGGITGQTSAWPGGLRLLAAGAQPAWFWPATGQVVPVGGLPAQRAGYQFIRTAGGWAIQAGSQAGCASCAGPPRAVYFLADDGASVTPVGRAAAVAPGPAGTLWLTSYPAAADPRTVAGTATEVSTAGRPLGPRYALPAGYLIEQGTVRGLLLAPAAQDPSRTADQLWDPAAARISRGFTAVIAASPAEIAWVPPCAARCRVQLLDLATGALATVELPAAGSVASAAFSPDGRLLALQVSFSDDSAAGAQAVRLEVASVATGHLAVVPQTWVGSDALAGFGWPAASDSLVADLNFTTTRQLAAWQPGATRLAIAALRPRPTPAVLVLGSYVP